MPLIRPNDILPDADELSDATLVVASLLEETPSNRAVDPRSGATAAVAPWNQSNGAGWISSGRPSGYNTPIAVPSQWSR